MTNPDTRVIATGEGFVRTEVTKKNLLKLKEKVKGEFVFIAGNRMSFNAACDASSWCEHVIQTAKKSLHSATGVFVIYCPFSHIPDVSGWVSCCRLAACARGLFETH